MKEHSVSLHVENLPQGASFRNHTLVWTPSYDFAVSQNKKGSSLLSEVTSLNKGPVGQQEYWISLIASDREFDVNHPLKLVVKDVNQKPEIKNFAPTGRVTLYSGQPFNFSVNAVDADGDKLTYTWSFEPGAEKLLASNLEISLLTVIFDLCIQYYTQESE